MATKRQINANRENARHSTGPKTPEGKARASLNAIRHGLLARQIVLPIEDRAQYLDLLAALEAEHQPEGPLETYLVHQMAASQWRLQRLTRIETGFFICRLRKVREVECGDDEDDDQPSARLTPDQQFDEDTRQLGILFYRDSCGDPFAKLARYENVLQREFYRALDRFLDARSRRTSPPPEKPAERNEPNLPPSPSVPDNLHLAPKHAKPPAPPRNARAPVGQAVSPATPIPRRPIRTPVVS
jgi:hypothetical protein